MCNKEKRLLYSIFIVLLKSHQSEQKEQGFDVPQYLHVHSFYVMIKKSFHGMKPLSHDMT